MQTMLEHTLEQDNVIEVNGRFFYSANEDALAMLPQDIVSELAKRHLEEWESARSLKAQKENLPCSASND